MRENIITNSAMCKHCEEILVSKHRHDFKTCSCHKASNDKLAQAVRDGMEPWSEGWVLIHKTCKGISVDGGLDYRERSAFNPGDIVELSVLGGTKDDSE